MKKFTVRLKENEHEVLVSLAQEMGMNLNTYIKFLIHQANKGA